MTKDEIKILAKKLNMELDNSTIDDILSKHEFFKKELKELQSFDTKGIAPMHRIDETETTFMREDIEGDVLPVKVIVENASDTIGNFISIDKVVK